MEKQFAAKYCCQLWIAFLLAIILCLLLIRIDYSTIIGSNVDVKVLVNNYVNGEQKAMNRNNSHQDLCLGRYIYIHDLPSQYNEDLLMNCNHLFNKKVEKFHLCVYTVNSGFGPQINSTSWFLTNQFLLDLIFHSRMKKYDCLTNDSSLASAIFVPFYAGLDLRRHLWGFNTSVRDESGRNLLKWLAEKPEWKRMWGMDHFLVGGRISNDFRRKSDKNSAWGSKFRVFPESKNISMLSIESSSWNNDCAIPYPTYFHPAKDSQVLEWQERMRRQKRQYLSSFVGAPRQRQRNSVRSIVIKQCLDSSSECKMLDCTDTAATDCDNPIDVMKVFRRSVFCLQPPGDSFTRRSIFDSILAGCIPVFFHPGSAYAQYIWHLPKNHTKYSVFIPGERVRDKTVRITEILLQISKGEVEAMREEVIRLIPRIIYGDHKFGSEAIKEDAFDLALKGILDRIEKFRKEIREGRDPSINFAARNDSKFKLLP
ncbi:putative Xyloglucan galactosyltransferase KATAMARI1 [Melia azedarach]|uniref:Xyloglucan galactosyltransferase KATAMARI1 n=1 Tax=Melia azedarach TaxID=155640 RepID=A0ACC1YHE1_MELAZ|nr:putative Xyloglucan galactosyltransferase KATAMARI1 [Melia azedarach]